MNTPMSVELEEVRNFLAEHDPFMHLDQDVLDSLPSDMDLHYVRRGDTIITAGAPNNSLWVIRSGAIDVLDEHGILLDRREAGRSFGYSTMVGSPESQYTMIAVEDSLLLALPRPAFDRLAARSPELVRSYSGQSARIRAAAQQLHQESNADVLRTTLGEFAIKNPANTTPSTSIRAAAQRMQRDNVSSLLIINEQDALVGIITDRDIRRSVAEDIAADQPVESIMATDLITATSDTLVFEAMLLMTEKLFHHLPIVDEGKVTGIIASADIMRLMQHDPIYLAADLSRRRSPEEMRAVYDSAHQVAISFIERGASPSDVTGLLTVVADNMARQLLRLAEEQLGPPPVPYAFVVLGSQARKEMGLASDQDNALILDDLFDAELHSTYFTNLTQYVCEGLATAGQKLCPGDMMASNPQWRMTQSQWAAQFHDWVTAPDGDALLYAQTFFDMRAIHGELSLGTTVHARAIESAQGSPRLHAHLAALAARREPPLGFFRGLVVDRHGEYKNTLDVKKGGTAALVQIARLFAIVGGHQALGSKARLAAAAGGAVSAASAENLEATREFLGSVTLRHQAEQVRAGQEPDYHIAPGKLSKPDREYLRYAFQAIKSMQNSLNLKYPVRSI